MSEQAPEKLRILLLNSADVEGADTWIHAQLMRNLDRAQHELHVACAPVRADRPSTATAAVQAIPGLTLRFTDFGPTFFNRTTWSKVSGAFGVIPALGSLWGLARYIREQRIQVLHSIDRPRDAVSCVVLAALTGAKSVIHVHVKFDSWMSRAVRWAFSRADALIAVSDFVARSLTAGGFAPHKTRVVLNGIDLERWDPRLDAATVRGELQLPAGAPVVISVSRLFPWKGHRELLQAMALVVRELPDARLVIVGADYPPGSGAQAELKLQAAELGLADRVLFTGVRSDVPRLMRAADVFALASIEEPFGLVFAEAMALERPVVALDSGGAPEVIDAESGRLSAPHDIAALARNLLELLRDPELRGRLGRRGRERVAQHFTAQRMAADTARVYESLVRPSR